MHTGAASTVSNKNDVKMILLKESGNSNIRKENDDEICNSTQS